MALYRRQEQGNAIRVDAYPAHSRVLPGAPLPGPLGVPKDLAGRLAVVHGLISNGAPGGSATVADAVLAGIIMPLHMTQTSSARGGNGSAGGRAAMKHQQWRCRQTAAAVLAGSCNAPAALHQQTADCSDCEHGAADRMLAAHKP